MSELTTAGIVNWHGVSMWLLNRLKGTEAKLKTVKYRHAALIEIYSHENCMNIESVEKRIDVFINEEQSHGDI